MFARSHTRTINTRSEIGGSTTLDLKTMDEANSIRLRRLREMENGNRPSSSRERLSNFLNKDSDDSVGGRHSDIRSSKGSLPPLESEGYMVPL